MKESQYEWTYLQKNETSKKLVPELKKINKSPKLAPYLWNRGIKDLDDVERFFNPKLSDFHDPFLLHDMEKVINRIQAAVEKGEKILVYGDYDADGITSTTVLKEAIELIGGEVTYYIPNRFSDGYGPNLDVYKEKIGEGIQLIITVDNGVSGHEAIEYAMNNNIDVIVTDHHELPETLPNAFAIIHPRHPSGNYPFKDLAGVGVAFKVATALLGEVPVESLDLVAIGTIADLVPLTDENRALVKIGLEILKQTDRIGLQMLAKEATFDLLDANEETVGFSIAPRLNAIGRLGDAMPGVTLLNTFDDEEAIQLAKMIQEKNIIRQEIVKKITDEALEMAKSYEDDEVLFLIGKDWHEGVLGIVASQVVQKTGKPTIVLNFNEKTATMKGSGRSVEKIDLFNTLSISQEELTSFGGHHMAVGLTFFAKHLDEIKKKTNDYLIENQLIGDNKTDLLIDKSLKINEVDIEYIELLNDLAPFGNGNPKIHIKIEDSNPSNFKRIGADGTHLKGQLTTDGLSLDCIAFNKGDDLKEFDADQSIDIVGQLSINEWNGLRKPQLMLTDYQVNGYQLFDLRGKKGVINQEQIEKCAFLIFNKEYTYQDILPKKAIFTVEGEAPINYEELNTYSELVILDCPYDLKIAKDVFSKVNIKRIYLKVDVEDEHYLKGLPSREQFTRLFQFISIHPKLDVRYKLDEISTYLKIEKKVLIFMIKVFFELGFVTMEDGLMKKVNNPNERPLQDSQIYQDYENKIEMEKLFLYSDIKEIKKWILHQEEIK